MKIHQNVKNLLYPQFILKHDKQDNSFQYMPTERVLNLLNIFIRSKASVSFQRH